MLVITLLCIQTILSSVFMILSPYTVVASRVLLWQVPLCDKSCFNVASSQSAWLCSVLNLELITCVSGEAETAVLRLD